MFLGQTQSITENFDFTVMANMHFLSLAVMSQMGGNGFFRSKKGVAKQFLKGNQGGGEGIFRVKMECSEQEFSNSIAWSLRGKGGR